MVNVDDLEDHEGAFKISESGEMVRLGPASEDSIGEGDAKEEEDTRVPDRASLISRAEHLILDVKYGYDCQVLDPVKNRGRNQGAHKGEEDKPGGVRQNQKDADRGDTHSMFHRQPGEKRHGQDERESIQSSDDPV